MKTKPRMRPVRISPERIQKLGVRTEQVERRDPAQTVRAVGTIQIDETRQTVIAPRFEGWIEKLYDEDMLYQLADLSGRSIIRHSEYRRKNKSSLSILAMDVFNRVRSRRA
jgi:hypothetical protein